MKRILVIIILFFSLFLLESKNKKDSLPVQFKDYKIIFNGKDENIGKKIKIFQTQNVSEETNFYRGRSPFFIDSQLKIPLWEKVKKDNIDKIIPKINFPNDIYALYDLRNAFLFTYGEIIDKTNDCYVIKTEDDYIIYSSLNTNLSANIEHYQKDIKVMEIEEKQKKYDAFIDTLKPFDKMLIDSVRFGYPSGVIDSIQAGADLEIVDLYGNTPLLIATQNNFILAIQYLLEKGANVNAVNSENITPLMIASIKGQTEIVKLLIAYKVDINKRSSLGLTAYDMVKINKYNDIMLMLQLAGAQ